MAFEFVPVPEFGLERAAEVLTRGFADYFVKLPFTAAGLLQLPRSDSVDLAASRVVVRGGAAVGVGLIARRGWTSRLAGMALVPEARRQGAGRALVQQLLAEAKARGERAMVLEVIEQNAAAVNLYARCGFRRVRRLVGFSCRGQDGGEATGAASLTEVDLRDLGAVVNTEGAPHLPWQLSGETVAALTRPTIGYRLNGAWVALSNLDAPQIAIRALITERVEQGRGRSSALLRAVMAKHPGKEWVMKAIWPEEFSAAFTAAGFTRTELTQWQMAREVS
jgi:ribosomal protein S18 acetylase RimI-like enzyme